MQGHSISLSSIFAEEGAAGLAVRVVQGGHHLQQVVVDLVADLRISLVVGVVQDEAPDEVRAGWQSAGSAV